MDSPCFLASVGTAVPACSLTQAEAFARLKARFEGKVKPGTLRIASKLFNHPAIKKRHFAFDDADRFFKETPDDRMDRFQKAATGLGAEAAHLSAQRAGYEPERFKALVVNTCTGYLCPGLSSYLIEALGLDPSVPAFDLVGQGCAGALPNLQLCAALLSKKAGGPILGISVEICSVDFQMGDDLSLILSSALFGDGAAAFTVDNTPSLLEIVAFRSKHLPEYRENIRFIYKNGALHNQLTPDLPEIVGREAAAFVKAFLHDQGLELSDLSKWAVHGGGANILQALETALPLPAHALDESKAVLENFGNMSSPSAFFALDSMISKGVTRGEYYLLLSFGAGFQIQAALLKAP